MSAYALPGSFFFPPSTMASATPEEDEDEDEEDVETNKNSIGGKEIDVLSSSSSVPLEMPSLAEMDTESRTSVGTTVGETSQLAATAVTTPTAPATEAASARIASTSTTTPGITELLIAVQSATVDPIRLLTSISTMRAGDVAYEAGVAGSRLIRHGLERMGSMVSSSPESSSSPSSDEAIEFHLRITFNGQKYTVTRTLPCFRQLRDDLIAELQARSEGARRRFGDASREARRRIIGDLSSTSNSNSYYPQPCLQKRDSLDDDADTADFLSVHGDDLDGEFEEDEGDHDVSVVIIPELPLMETSPRGTKSGTPTVATDTNTAEQEQEEEVVSWSNSMPRFAGRSLSRLHAAVKLYAPVMEGWLRQVADIIPPNSSPSLMQFLLEPLTPQPHHKKPAHDGADATFFGEAVLDTWNRTTGFFFSSLPPGTSPKPQRQRQRQREQVFQLDSIDENKEVVAEYQQDDDTGVMCYDSDLDEDDVGEFFHAAASR